MSKQMTRIWCFTCGDAEASHVDVLDVHPTMGCCGRKGCCVLVDVADAEPQGWWRGPLEALAHADDPEQVKGLRPCTDESDDERVCRLPHDHAPTKHTDGFKEWPCGHPMHDDNCACGHPPVKESPDAR